jgi:uncharacterized cupin superfamily protein
MADVTVKRADEMEAIFQGGMRRVRAELGVTSFGIQLEELPANFNDYPEHDHSEDGQEEVFIILSGSATLDVEGEQHELKPGVYARVGPGQKRKIVTGPDGAQVLCLGAKPGTAYEPPDWTELGAPDPMEA